MARFGQQAGLPTPRNKTSVNGDLARKGKPVPRGMMKEALAQRDATLGHLVELGIALSAERDHRRLLERILMGAKTLADADGGTLYLLVDNELRFELMRNDTLRTAFGGPDGTPIPFAPLPLFCPDGRPNHHNVATYAASSGETVCIADAYHDEAFDFSGTKAFDAQTGYRSMSFLTVPLKNHEGDILGVLQLINARKSGSRQFTPFDDRLVPLIEALAGQAAVALDNQTLIRSQRDLFDAFIKMMAQAIDAKSPYTGNHCQRVPQLTEMLAAAACAATDGVFANFNLTPEQWYELKVAGGLHDVGKVATPVHILDKATKLEKIHDRISEIATRIELLMRDAEIVCLNTRLAGTPQAEAEALRDARLAELRTMRDFLAHANIGCEFMADGDITELQRIAAETWSCNEQQRCLLDADELENLSIRRGTLTAADRRIINDHIVYTIQMLEALPFPKHLRNVPEIAGGHHEKMDGTGYPKGLKRHEMSWLARMMGVADIFEALTAADRPYKQPKKLSESLAIMAAMKRDNHIDPDIFDLFLESGIWRRYAEQFLDPDQIDDVDITAYLNKGPGVK